LAKLYISNTGDDGNSGTRDAPLATFTAAFNRVADIYADHVSSGTWHPEDFAEIIVLDDVDSTPFRINGAGNIYPTIMISGDTETDGAPTSTVKNTAFGAFLTIIGGAKVRLGNKLTLDADQKGHVVLVDISASLVMEDGATVTGGLGSGGSAGGGGVYVGSGTFTMEGGTIAGNTAPSSYRYGGGVYVGSGTFKMAGGTIERNTASSSSYGGGGGVYVWDSGTFTMTGGTIAGNTASASSYSYGGGVFVDGGTFTMEGGTIAENEAFYGGGVYVNSGTFTMTGGTIAGNTASSSYNSYGGGVFVNSGTFTMEGGTIERNTASSSASSYGGGVYVWDSGTFTMTGGTIAGNTASSSSNSYGGGVYVRSSSTKFEKTAGAIIYGIDAPDEYKNTSVSGAAVYVGMSRRREKTVTADQELRLNVTGKANTWVDDP
jgi:hypothetical protein